MLSATSSVIDETANAALSAACALARHDLLFYVQSSCRGYSTAPLHAEICERLTKFLDDVRNKRSPRLAIFVPPRFGKSFIASERFPAWAIGNHPDLRFIVTAYGHDLASDFTRHSIDLCRSTMHRQVFPKFELSDNLARSDRWATRDGGGYYGVGVGGALTGMGADVLIIDDPVRNWADALSESKRRAVWEWYTTTAYTRLMPGAGVMLIQTRWHQDDLGGRILEKGGFDVIKYPALREENGVPVSLDPVRWGVESLQDIKATIGDTAFRCLYQQEPTDAEGAEFKRSTFCFHDEAPTIHDIVISVDATFKASSDSDFVSIQTWAEHERSYYLLDNVTARMGYGDTLSAVESIAQRYEHHRPTIIIEDKANGSAIIESIRKRFSRVIPVNPDGGKVARARAILPLFDARRVSFPSKAPWLDRFVNELADFPNAKHDDQVDAMTQALNYLEYNKAAPPTINRNPLYRR